MFKVGDHVESTSVPDSGTGVVTGFNLDGRVCVTYESWYKHCCEDPDKLRLVQSASPVRTETITRSVIVPGVYGRVGVGAGPVLHDAVDSLQVWTADELDAAALVLTQLAAAVRDAN